MDNRHIAVQNAIQNMIALAGIKKACKLCVVTSSGNNDYLNWICSRGSFSKFSIAIRVLIINQHSRNNAKDN